MNHQSQNRIRQHWLGCIAMIAFASVLSPINIHIVIAQESPEIVIAPADPGEPPVPPQEPAVESPASAAAASETPAQAPVEPLTPAVEAPSVEPAPASAPVQTPDVPDAPSEISSDTELGKLLPKEEPFVDAKAPVNESVRTLSVEPGTRPVLPDDHPAWVGAAPDFSTAQHYLYVCSLPAHDPQKVEEALDESLLAAVRNYIDQEVVNQQGAADAMPVTAEFIRRNLIDNPEGYECELTTGQEPLYQKWVTIRITPEQRELFRKWHTEAIQRSRLAPLGVCLVSFLLVISLSHGVLRRFSGASPLAAVNQLLPEQVASRKTRSSARWIFFALLLGAVVFAFLLPLIAIVKTSPVQIRPTHFEVGDMPDLHKEVRVEKLNGHRTIILESKSHR